LSITKILLLIPGNILGIIKVKVLKVDTELSRISLEKV
jgi:hypothetical protein